jgi:hypothetical protein
MEFQIKQQFGPGVYSVLISETGVRGLQNFKDVDIPWNVTYMGWMDREPTIDEVRNSYGPGSYFILKSCQVRGWHVPSLYQEYSKTTYEFLQDGAPVMKNILIIFRVDDMPWL